MKGKWSLNRLLNNSKLMVVFSIVASIAIWAVVNYTIVVDSTLDITNVPAALNLEKEIYGTALNMEIFGDSNFSVTITVSGARWKLQQLTANDFKIEPNYQDVSLPGGFFEVGLSPKFIGSNASEITIVDYEPKTVDIYCAPRSSADFQLEISADGVGADPETGYQLGTPVIRSNLLDNNMINIYGPSTQITRIKRLVTKIHEPKIISQLENFTADIVALDSSGNEVDITYCTLSEYNDRQVTVQIPVLLTEKVDLTYSFTNMPAAFKNKNGLFTVSPSSITISGEPSLVREAAETIGNLGEIDFRQFSLSNVSFEKTIPVVSGISVVEDVTSATVSMRTSGMAEKTVNLPLTLGGNVVVQNRPEGKTITLSSTALPGIKLVGNASSIEKISASNLSVTVNMDFSATAGTFAYPATITISGYNDVWVYLPKESERPSIFLATN